MDLAGKVVVVTGASRGIGRQTALEFARRGARVVVTARTVGARRTLPGSLEEVVALIVADGGEAVAVACDVAVPADVERLVEAAVATFGGLDVVVNNAADMVGGDFEQLLEAMLGTAPVGAAGAAGHSAPSGPLDDWLRQFAVNVHGPYLLATLAVPHLKARGGGVIVNITSESAQLVPLEVALRTRSLNPSVGYGVTKAALDKLTNALAARVAGDGIAVIAVDPGVVFTEVAGILTEAGLRPEMGAPPSVPATVVVDLVAGDPMARSGEVVRAQG